MKLINYLKNAIDFIVKSEIFMAVVFLGSLIVPMIYADKKPHENQITTCERKEK